ncbi:hypothetical protein ACFPYJ_11515 [Paenibacillus solisilvae]|uniref:Uncharacterized protein n=1 Tax=Paenibacillus solisilvae TaxID=2486751 RepID=A0ABW0VV39_9BACL
MQHKRHTTDYGSNSDLPWERASLHKERACRFQSEGSFFMISATTAHKLAALDEKGRSLIFFGISGVEDSLSFSSNGGTIELNNHTTGWRKYDFFESK